MNACAITRRMGHHHWQYEHQGIPIQHVPHYKELMMKGVLVQEGLTTGENAQALTKHRLEESRKKCDEVATYAFKKTDDMIKFKGRPCKKVPKLPKLMSLNLSQLR
jgi:hypothetical protein